MELKIEKIRAEALQELSAANTLEALQAVRLKYLGKKGELTKLLRSIGKLPPEERPRLGQLANEVRLLLENELEDRGKHTVREIEIRDSLNLQDTASINLLNGSAVSNSKIEGKATILSRQERQRQLATEVIDVTLPGRPVGTRPTAPLDHGAAGDRAIFSSMGFEVAEGPEVESDYYNFQALNIPKEHPPATCRTLSTSPMRCCCARIPLRCRCASWSRRCPACRCGS